MLFLVKERQNVELILGACSTSMSTHEKMSEKNDSVYVQLRILSVKLTTICNCFLTIQLENPEPAALPFEPGVKKTRNEDLNNENKNNKFRTDIAYESSEPKFVSGSFVFYIQTAKIKAGAIEQTRIMSKLVVELFSVISTRTPRNNEPSSSPTEQLVGKVQYAISEHENEQLFSGKTVPLALKFTQLDKFVGEIHFEMLLLQENEGNESLLTKN